jgi:hypothetical protein
MRLEAFTAVSIMLVLSWVLALYGLTLALKMVRACNFATLASTYETKRRQNPREQQHHF